MLEKIKKLREKTGAGVVDIKKALNESEGDEGKALDILKRKGMERAGKKSQRTTEEGVVADYIHSNRKVGAVVKILCETDFVARNEEFIQLATDIAMHVVAMNPKYIKEEDVSAEEVEKEKEIWTEQLKDQGKPKEIISQILSGKEAKFRQELALLSQPFVKNPDQTVQDLISEKIAKMGENIQVSEFYRVEL